MVGAASPVRPDPDTGYVVRAPRATDAVGHTLRTAFGGTAMPRDWAALIERLDRVAVH